MSRARVITIELGTTSVTLTPHNFPGIGPRIIIEFRERDIDHRFNVTPDQLRHLCQHGTLAATEAEAMAEREQHRGAA